MAESLQAQKRNTEAISVYEQAMQQYPHHPNRPPTLLKLAWLYYTARQDALKALSLCQTIHDEFPDSDWSRQALVQQARIYEEQREWSEAIQSYAALLEQDLIPQYKTEYLYRMAHLHYLRGDYRQASLELESFLEQYAQSPWRESALWDLAEVSFRQRNYTKALELYDTILKVFAKSPRVIEAKYQRGLCLEHLGAWDKALQVYLSLQGRYPNPSLLNQQIQNLRRLIKEMGS